MHNRRSHLLALCVRLQHLQHLMIVSLVHLYLDIFVYARLYFFSTLLHPFTYIYIHINHYIIYACIFTVSTIARREIVLTNTCITSKRLIFFLIHCRNESMELYYFFFFFHSMEDFMCLWNHIFFINYYLYTITCVKKFAQNICKLFGLEEFFFFSIKIHERLVSVYCMCIYSGWMCHDMFLCHTWRRYTTYARVCEHE